LADSREYSQETSHREQANTKRGLRQCEQAHSRSYNRKNQQDRHRQRSALRFRAFAAIRLPKCRA
jgi:hypothetical protein